VHPSSLADKAARLTLDVSPEFEDTWAFLDRRIADTMAAGKAIKELTQAASTWLEGSMRK
jgi:hypothetical protein